MTQGFISRVTSADQLKTALDTGSARARGIADRVSKASLANQDGFSLPSNRIPAPGQNPAQPVQSSEVDLESEMTDLADTQLRFSATARLLAKAYEQVRSSLK